VTARVERLTIRDRAGVALVREASLALQRGHVTAVIGASGGGKSLIAQAIMGLLPAGFRAEGTLRLGSRTVSFDAPAALAAAWGRETLLLPQEPRAALDPTSRIGRHLAWNGAGGAAVARHLAAVDLPAEVARAFPFMLSGGMAQRVLVATALAGEAGVIVADEPTKGLDPERVERVADLFAGLARSGRAIMLISHDMAFVRRLANEVWLLHDGRLARIDPSTGAAAKAEDDDHARDWFAADPRAWDPCESCAAGGMVLAAHGLSARHGSGPPLFRGLDVHLSPGSVLGVAGASGSGKSTLGDVLLGLKAPTAGDVSWAGIDPYRDVRGRTRSRRRYQKLHQDPLAAFLPTRPIGRQLADLAAVHAPAGELGRRANLLDRLGLHERLLSRYPAEVSGGEGQRLALLRLLLLDPSVIVADEPTSRLDPIAQKAVIDLLRGIAERDRVALVLIAHDRVLLAKTTDALVDLSARS
jgi:peptide/nickel transport system ATP-binding protein